MSRALRLLALGSVLLASVGTAAPAAYPDRAKAPAPESSAEVRPGLALAETIRTLFPTVAGRLEGAAGLAPASRELFGREVAGYEWTVDVASPFRVFLPARYDGPFVAEVGRQRVVLRPVGARSAPARPGGGVVAFENVHAGVDSLHVAGTSGTEEFLLVRERSARHFVEYEVVEATGVTDVVLRDGKVRFEGEGDGPRIELDRPWLVDSGGRLSNTTVAWEIAAAAPGRTTRLRLTWSDRDLRYPLLVDPSFVAAGTIIADRYQHTATLLPGGKVLLAGGYGEGPSILASAELYEPVTGRIAPTGSLTTARGRHTATLLPSGKVLVIGGRDASGVVLSSAELYDPATGSFTATGSLATARINHTATLLPSGRVLVAGGENGSYVATAELYDPAANGGVGAFTSTGSLGTARSGHLATLLPSGKVLVAGGSNGSILTSAELYDPAGNGGAGAFAVTGSFVNVHTGHTATLLPSGKVLVVGGSGGTAELYDPAANGGVGAFASTGSLVTARSRHTASLLPSGKVLVAGGYAEDGQKASLATAELFDPAANGGVGAFAAAGSLNAARDTHTSTLLPDGRVVFLGGEYLNSVTAQGWFVRVAEQYDPVAGIFSATGPLATGRSFHTATLLADGRTLIAGGWVGGGAAGILSTAELFDPSANGGAGAFTTAGSLATGRYLHSATLLPDGRVLVAGGQGASGALASAELFDPTTGTFTATGSLSTPRFSHSATLLPTGKVLLAGGEGSSALGSAELFDPSASGGAGAFATTGSLVHGREQHSATLLADGRVLLAGGSFYSATLASAELYDPITAAFTSTGNLMAGRVSHVAALLPSGKVLLAGGAISGGATYSAELFDPVSGTSAMTGYLVASRQEATATALPSGRVLVAGGWNRGGVLDSVELYDPLTGTFSTTGSLAGKRRGATSTLLPSGRVLVAGGSYSSTYLATAELFSDGLGYQDAWRPVLVSVTSPANQAASVIAMGSRFTGLNGNGPEASGGGTQSSATNYPLLQLQRLDNGESAFLPLAPATGYSATSFTSSTAWLLNPGPALAIVYVNGIPSVAKALVLGCGVSITGQPASQTVAAGSLATFSVATVAASRYQWQRDPTASGAWANIDGATQSTYTTPAVVGPESGTRYRVLVSGTCATVASNPATLTVSDSNPPTASVVSPAGGEYWLLSPTSGPVSTQVVAWSMADDVRVCQVAASLRYSNDGGSTWATAASAGGLPATYGTGPGCAYPGVATSNLTYTVPTSFPSGRAGSLYKVRVTVTDQAGNATTVDSANPFYIVSPNPDSVKTLILHNLGRQVTKGWITAQERSDLLTRLEDLSNHPRVQGVIVDLGGVATLTPLYAAWDAAPSNPDLANEVLFGTGGLQSYLRTNLLAAYPGVKYLVLVGDDRAIPLARMPDGTVLLQEKAYVTAGSITTVTAVGAALNSNRYLSDDPLGVKDAVTTAGLAGNLYVPDLAVGRLVEKPAEIAATIAAFISQDGVLDLTKLDAAAGHKVLVTGYDFLTNAATQIRARWKSSLGVSTPDASTAPVYGTLVGSSWGPGDVASRRTALRNALAGTLAGDPTVGHYALLSLSGHATHFEEGVPGTGAMDIQGLAASQVYGVDASNSCTTGNPAAVDLAGAIVYALGCHGGLPVPGSCQTDADHSLDLAQTMMARGAVAYLANTGFGWGLKNGIGYGTRLAQILTEQLTSGGTQAIGDAVLRTKQRYYLETPRFDPYDQKSLQQWTLYGLPMYAVVTGIATGSRAAGMEVDRTFRLGPIDGESRVATDTLAALPDHLLQLNLHFNLSASGVYVKHDSTGNVLATAPGCGDTAGCYYTLNGLVDRGTGAGDLPIEPYFIFDSRLSGTSQHGVLWKGGTYREETGWKPVLGELVSNGGDGSNHGAAPRVAMIAPTDPRLVVGADSPTCRPSDVELNGVTVTVGEVAKVNDTDATFTINRLYQTVDLENLYFNDTATPTNNCDRTGPSLGTGPYAGKYHEIAGMLIRWAVPASDDQGGVSGVWRVLVVYDDNSVDAQGMGAWVPLELADDGTGTWRGSTGILPGMRMSYALQAVDARGNVTWLDFQTAQLPASGVPLGIPQVVDASAPTIVVTGFTPASGPVGTPVSIAGQGLAGATAVTFNGVAASFAVGSDTQITATVPAGATTGPIAVTGPGGTSKSASSFVVTWTLTVTRVGSGSVTSSPSGIDCGTTCAAAFAGGTSVTLTAVASGGSTFAGWSGEGCSGTGTCTVSLTANRAVTATFSGGSGATLLYPLTPCRVVDTRNADGPLGGPALPAGGTRSFVIGGSCGVPADAAAISLNVTAVSPASAGSLTLYPGTGTAPGTTTLSYGAGRTRANNSIMGLVGGQLSVLASQPSGTVHVIIDVNGYFR
ncbi:MAG: kelch repeat-containing protein [Thermoanaerobaculia bacterium]